MSDKQLPLTFPRFDEREIELLRECLQSLWVTQGPMVEKFEHAVAELHQVRYARSTTSCTAALHLAMLALGVGPGDEVIVPAFTWITSANCAEYVGARAVFVDVDPFTFNLDIARVAAAITPRTRAIIAVHLFGLAADIDALRDVIGGRDIVIVEDAACALGTTLRGRPVGGLGDIGCFSFHPRKVVTTGEGGMVTTDDQVLAEAVGSYRNHGATGVDPDSPEAQGPWTMATFNRLGFNLRMSDIQAAVGLAQLEKFPTLLHERRARAMDYNARLAGCDGLQVPDHGPDAGHAYQSYVVRLTSADRATRNTVMTRLAAAGISTRPGTHAVPVLGYYRQRYGYSRNDFPTASTCEDTTITLPLFPGMTADDVERVSAAFLAAMCGGNRV
ncbi:MAG: DegT/DnrJ/EryC1/StrS family aminotransferase [Gammaproteobacteria bacterium]|nr:DegT/DnrJ/EryC1/StrS family aminotransferase [Gammaproteobacteria bacterium]